MMMKVLLYFIGLLYELIVNFVRFRIRQENDININSNRMHKSLLLTIKLISFLLHSRNHNCYSYCWDVSSK